MNIRQVLRAIRWSPSTRLSSRRGLRSSSSASCLPISSTDSIGSNELWHAWRGVVGQMERLIQHRPRMAQLVITELEALLHRLHAPAIEVEN